MKGFMGCDADLKAGAVIVSGKHLEITLVVIRPVTEDEARKDAERMGTALIVVPGERFYEVEVTTKPIGSQN